MNSRLLECDAAPLDLQFPTFRNKAYSSM